MKINQLFRKRVDTETLLQVIRCFGIKGLADKRCFCKSDLVEVGTVASMQALVPTLEEFYLPCKSRVYLEDLTEKRAITVLKQVLRLHGYFLASRERNFNNRKVIFYRLMNEMESILVPKMQHFQVTSLLDFA
jgi:hypothetical protein